VTEPDKQLLSALRHHRVLAEFEPAALEYLSRSGEIVALGPKERLFSHGEPATRVFVVLRGRVELVLDDDAGNRTRFAMVAPPGGVAFNCAFGEGNYPYSAESSSSDTIVVALPASDLVACLKSDPSALRAMLAEASAHLRRLVAQVSGLKLKDSVQRLAGYIIELCSGQTGEVEIVLPTEKQIVADRLGMKPETLSRALARLDAMGLAHNAESLRLRVPEPSRLERLYHAGEEGVL